MPGLLNSDFTGGRGRSADPNARHDRKNRHTKTVPGIMQMRPDYGVPLTDQQYETAKGVTGQYEDVLEAIGQIEAPGFEQPEEAVLWAGGDGDKPQKYTLPADKIEEVLNTMASGSDGMYHWTRHSDGSYGLAFGEYGKEGYEALNDLSRKYDTALQSGRDIAQVGRDTATEVRGMYTEGANYQYSNFITNLQEDYQERVQNNSETINALMASGILSREGRAS